MPRIILTVLLIYPGIFSVVARQPDNLSMNSRPGFIENKGQIIDQNNKPNPAVLYLLNTPGMNVQLRRSGFSYDVYSVSSRQSAVDSPVRDSFVNYPLSIINYHRIDIDLEGANPECLVIPSDPLPDYFNYFTASVPSDGIKDIRQYSKITCKNIYPAVDLEFFTNKEKGYKYNFVIHPGGDINDIRLRIGGPQYISLIRDTLIFGTRFGDMEELIPESYYLINDTRVYLHSRFKKINDEVYGFSVDKAIPSNAVMVIDPTPKRLWGTYYGGENNDVVGRCATDKAGNVFLYGMTNSLVNIASAGSYQGILAGETDCFLTKFNAAGQRQWGTYFGGINAESASSTGGLAIAVDESGNICFAGCTSSLSGIATPGAHQTIFGGGENDAFLEKFSQDGYRIWGTYYGGALEDRAGCIATDMNGNVFLAGDTRSSSGIATPGSYQPVLFNSGKDAFFVKFDSNGARQWGTYYGGDTVDFSYSCTTDGSGHVYFAGWTTSQSNIASPGAFQTIYGGGAGDGFLAKFTTGGQRVWATYYGGESDDGSGGCIVDSAGNLCMAGGTASLAGIASAGCHQPVYGGGAKDGFIVKFDSSGQRLWGTYYGGSSYDLVSGCAFGWNGDIFVAGYSSSVNNISTPDAYQSTLNGYYSDGILVKFNAAGQRQWGSYYGGSLWDHFYNCNYVTDDTLYVAGTATSTDNMASPGAWQQSYGGGLNDCILIKFLDCWPIIAGPISGPDTLCLPSNGVNYSIPPLIHAMNYIWTLPPGFTLTSGAGTASITIDLSTSAVSGRIWVKGLNKCGDPGDSASLYITVSQPPVPVISGPDTTCAGAGKVYTTASGNTNYQWSVSAGGVITAGGTTSNNTVTVTWNTIGTQHVWLKYTNAYGCEALTATDYVVEVTSSPAVDITISSTSNNVCSGTQVTFNSVSTNGGGDPFYQWQVNGIHAGTDTSSFSYVPLNNDSVRCILTSSIIDCIMNNPDTSNMITMVVNPRLPVSVDVSVSPGPVCQGDPVTLTAFPSNGGTLPVYQWIVNGAGAGANNSVLNFVPGNGDKVICILTSDLPCVINDTASDSIFINTTDPHKVTDTTLCYGTPYFAQGAWQTTGGIYHDTLANPVACIRFIETHLNYKPAIPVDLGNDTILCGNTIILNAYVPGGTYLWQDGSKDSIYVVTLPGEYSVLVGCDGCVNSDSIKIGDCSVLIWFPNAFTPNSDGLNDTFHPIGNGIEKFSMQIFNRWGTMVFETSSPEKGWDGTYKGSLCQEETYVFKASYSIGGGKVKQVTGTITLQR